MTHARKSNMLKRIVRRRSFVGLMDLYESNFKLLQRLAPDLCNLGPHEVSRAEGSPDLHLKVVERCKFTTTLLLTYYFQQADGALIADPELHVRLYHDAGVVEAMSCRREGFMALDPEYTATSGELGCKWDSNLFLEKWLEYSLAQGHSFGCGQRSEHSTFRNSEPVETP